MNMKKYSAVMLLIFSISFLLPWNVNAKDIVYKTYEIAEEIEVAGEPFYVISQTDDTITLFAKYNLNVGDNFYGDSASGIQNENVRAWRKDGGDNYGAVPFYTNGSYWAGTITSYPSFVYGPESNLYQYLTFYESYLKDNTELEVKEVTLLSVEQAADLGCNINGRNDCDYEWMYSSTYWLGTAMDDTNLYYFTTNERMFYANDFSGVRPVVTVSKEIIKDETEEPGLGDNTGNEENNNQNTTNNEQSIYPETGDNINLILLIFGLNAIILLPELKKRIA